MDLLFRGLADATSNMCFIKWFHFFWSSRYVDQPQQKKRYQDHSSNRCSRRSAYLKRLCVLLTRKPVEVVMNLLRNLTFRSVRYH